MEIEEIGLLPHHRVAVVPLPGPQYSGILIKPDEIRLFIASRILKASVFGVQHQINQAFRRGNLFFLNDVKNSIAHPEEFRNVIFHAHGQILYVIAQWIYQPVFVETGGIGSENTSVRLPVGKHHMKVADGMLLVLGVSSSVGKHQHGIVINAVIITGGFLCELTVGIAVNPLYQVNTCAFRQLFIIEKNPAFRQ